MGSIEKSLQKLLSDFGYSFQGDRLIEDASRMFSMRVVGRYRGIYHAAESLIPIIRDDEYYGRFQRICERA